MPFEEPDIVRVPVAGLVTASHAEEWEASGSAVVKSGLTDALQALDEAGDRAGGLFCK